MNNTQTKYILIGAVFWLGILAIIIFTIHYSSNTKYDIIDTNNTTTKSTWFVQVASFEDRGLLKKLNNSLIKNKYKTKIVFSVKTNGNVVRAIRIGPYKTESLAKQTANNVKATFKVKPKVINSTAVTPNN